MNNKCAPGKKYENGTCFTTENLINIAISLNKKNPKNQIKIIKDKKYLLKNITKNMKNMYNCRDQICWLNTDIVKKLNDDEINFFTFRPDGPEKKTAWLSTSDINKVMYQYEKKYNNFKFFGAVPYDFGKLPFLDIYNINFNKLLEAKKNKIGLVINLDKHTEKGSHWVGLYSDLDKNQIYFFDSFAKPPGNEIKKLVTKILEFMYNKKFNKKLTSRIIDTKHKSLGEFDVSYNKKRHQFKSSECGVYSMNFILRLLNDKETFRDISNNITKDDKMNSCRKTYFI